MTKIRVFCRCLLTVVGSPLTGSASLRNTVQQHWDSVQLCRKSHLLSPCRRAYLCSRTLIFPGMQQGNVWCVRFFHLFPSDSRQYRHRRRDLGERGESSKKGYATHSDRNTLMMLWEALNTLLVVFVGAHVQTNTSLYQKGAPSMSSGKFWRESSFLELHEISKALLCLVSLTVFHIDGTQNQHPQDITGFLFVFLTVKKDKKKQSCSITSVCHPRFYKSQWRHSGFR